MIEYLVIFIMMDVTPLGDMLNSYAKDGWRFVGSVGNQVILEREMTPRVEENATENSRSVTYSWDFPRIES